MSYESRDRMKEIDKLKSQGIDVEHSIELLGDQEMYEETLQDFLDEIEERLTRIQEDKDKNDWENYAIEVHALKGDSNYLGFTKLAEMALEHQLKSQEKDANYIEAHYEELLLEIERITSIVRDYFSSK